MDETEFTSLGFERLKNELIKMERRIRELENEVAKQVHEGGKRLSKIEEWKEWLARTMIRRGLGEID